MSELYEILRNSLDDTGLPVMDRDQFKDCLLYTSDAADE